MNALQYFRLFAAEFSAVIDADVTVWLTSASYLIVTDCLDAERAAMAQALYAAHLLSLATRAAKGGSASTGTVRSEKEGDLQRTYGTTSGSETYIGQTSYGLQYLDITTVCAGSSIMTRGAT
jgi:hypothetical protein